VYSIAVYAIFAIYAGLAVRYFDRNILFILAAACEIQTMEFTTPRRYYNTFYMILSGIIIVISFGLWQGGAKLYAMLILSAIILLAYMAFSTILSIDIIDDHLVLKTISCFRKRTILLNIREVELPLFYTPRGPGRKDSAFYSMYIVKGGKRLHEIRYGVTELSTFIAHFNSKKAGISN
jgi:hypothetical protein